MAPSRYPTVEKLNRQINNMTLVDGKGGEDDVFNVVYIYDSLALPFHRAEQYMQVSLPARPRPAPHRQRPTRFRLFLRRLHPVYH